MSEPRMGETAPAGGDEPAAEQRATWQRPAEEPDASQRHAGAGVCDVGAPHPAPAAAESELRLHADTLDGDDDLAGVRDRFALDDATVYLDGNSLGALPRHVPARVAEVITREWGELRIRSWDESGWWTAPERVGDRVAPLVGAAPGQIVVGDSTSVNVFKVVAAAARTARAQDPARTEVLVDAATFPTDGYIAGAAARMTGCTVRPVPVSRMTGALGERTAVALVNHVDYRTGRMYDMASLTRAVHEVRACCVWDLCHSAGALPVYLDRCGVDYAVGCTYKYLNGGPGAPAFLYIRADLQEQFESPLPGWNSHADPFAMEPGYRPARGVRRGRVGTPEVLALLALDAALDVWDGVTMAQVRAKSLALTDFFTRCVDALVPGGLVVSLTPREPELRGSQVSLRCPGAGEVMAELIARGVVGDYRAPDVLRFGFTPLYTRFVDALTAARTLADVLEAR